MIEAWSEEEKELYILSLIALEKAIAEYIDCQGLHALMFERLGGYLCH
jgi:hypothetical protein